jgi:hypothetical protein
VVDEHHPLAKTPKPMIRDRRTLVVSGPLSLGAVVRRTFGAYAECTTARPAAAGRTVAWRLVGGRSAAARWRGRGSGVRVREFARGDDAIVTSTSALVRRQMHPRVASMATLALVTPASVTPGRYKPPDSVLAFLEGLG